MCHVSAKVRPCAYVYSNKHIVCMRRILLLTLLLSACSASSMATESSDRNGASSTVLSPETTSIPRVVEASAVPVQVTPPGVRIVAVGDVACAVPSTCRHTEVAALVRRLDPTAFLVLGDVQYPSGSLKDFRASYDVSFGAFMPLTYPSPGNHEMQSNRAGYDEYFHSLESRVDVHRSENAVWYSFSAGGWHFVSLDSNHPADPEQLAWLKEDLRKSQTQCQAVFWHHPRFSSGQHGSSTSVSPLWEAAIEGGADIVLTGHDHNYERFAPVTVSGAIATDSTANTAVQFVVGTGGKSLRGLATRAPNSEVFNSQADGVLELTLYPDKADFRFVSTADDTLDAGSVLCD